MNTWKPAEIIVNETVKDDPVTNRIISQCADVPVKYVDSGRAKAIESASDILTTAEDKMLPKILAGKCVVYIAPAGVDTVDKFTMPDDRLLCPHFDRLKLASNGCFYACDWCYLKLTYRNAFPFITVRGQYEKIERQLGLRLSQTDTPVIFNAGELADSLSLEHLTGAAQHFIPWFGKQDKGFLFMLTKSDNVDAILDLPHNGHTIVAWSMNNAQASRRWEIGAPTFERRLAAARKVQEAGYPMRIRLDPIVPFDGWQEAYASTIEQIFTAVQPERVTLGTLRFEPGFYKMRKQMFTTGDDLLGYLDQMQPMFEPMELGQGKVSVGKYSFDEARRIEIFGFAIDQIRKYSDCTVALCKESEPVCRALGLPPTKYDCVCQL